MTELHARAIAEYAAWRSSHSLATHCQVAYLIAVGMPRNEVRKFTKDQAKQAISDFVARHRQ